MLTDTHCHLDFNKFDEDRDAVIQRALAAGVERILIPALGLGIQPVGGCGTGRGASRIFYAAVGFHPTDLEKWNDRQRTAFEECHGIRWQTAPK